LQTSKRIINLCEGMMMIETDLAERPQTLHSKTPSARALAEHRNEILFEWENLVREKISSAKNLPHPLIIDTVPKFIDNLAEALCEDHARKTATESSSISQEHGGERARLSRYSPDQLIVEYQILRDTISRKLESLVLMTTRDRGVIQNSFDTAICEAMVAFFLVHSKIREHFTAGLTHDLRNPLGVMRMAADLIVVTLNDANWHEMHSDLCDLAKRIINNSKRADRLIQDLLDTNLIQMGDRMQLNIGECEILSIIKDVLADMDRNDSARIRLEGSPQWGFWDGVALRRVLDNLVTNAFKYGSRETPVTIHVSSAEGRLLLTVHNHGSHIPIEDQEVLFQAFRRSQAAKESGMKGWGIGLALVRGVAEAHGGSVSIESSAELGTTFVFDIPVDARPYLNAPVT
jgi:signal transduction histidine kinase